MGMLSHAHFIFAKIQIISYNFKDATVVVVFIFHEL